MWNCVYLYFPELICNRHRILKLNISFYSWNSRLYHRSFYKWLIISIFLAATISSTSQSMISACIKLNVINQILSFFKAATFSTIDLKNTFFFFFLWSQFQIWQLIFPKFGQMFVCFHYITLCCRVLQCYILCKLQQFLNVKHKTFLNMWKYCKSFVSWNLLCSSCINHIYSYLVKSLNISFYKSWEICKYEYISNKNGIKIRMITQHSLTFANLKKKNIYIFIKLKHKIYVFN